MTSIRRSAAAVLVAILLGLLLAASLFLTGCRKEEAVFIDTNLPPDTRLTSAPGPPGPPYPQESYRVHFYWDGTDPDGYVVAYYFAWDDTVAGAWVYTTDTDSLFKAVIDTTGETRLHTFYVRAVDNEGKLDPTPSRVRFAASTDMPVIDFVYRKWGPEDPDPENDNYNPGYKDTVLMGTTCEFLWGGHDPDGMGSPVTFSYRLDSNPFTEFADVTTATVSGIGSGTHFFHVKIEDETGAESFSTACKFVMNYSPDSDITMPDVPTGTLTVADGERIVFHWTARDLEEEEGPVGGGIRDVWIELDTGFQKSFTVGSEDYQEHFMFTSDTTALSEHYISSVNLPQGGNKWHEFRVYARDVQGRFESPSELARDRERFKFWYNFPPSTTITYPTEGDTVCPDFTVRWDGVDPDGTVAAYQYVLDPTENSWRQTDADSLEYSGIEAGREHEFWVRARDSADCWEVDYQYIRFWVKECE